MENTIFCLIVIIILLLITYIVCKFKYSGDNCTENFKFTKLQPEVETFINEHDLDYYEDFSNDLINKNDIIFIHVGKTGGSTMKSVFNFKEIHHQVATFNKNKKYIISIRHPIKRLISAYNMSKSLIIHNDLGVSEKPVFTRFKKNGYYYTEEYDRIFKKFKSLNDLCEQIFTSDDAYNLVTSTAPYQHLGKNTSWYLNNGEFIKKYHKNIIYVTKQETLNDDINNIAKMIGMDINYNSEKDRRVNKNKDEYLSPLAIKNLIDYFKDTEYKTLQVLYEYGFIDKEYLDYCYTYNAPFNILPVNEKFCNNQNKLEYHHIPKTGGTSIEDFGKLNNILWGRFNKDYKIIKKINGVSFWHDPNFSYRKDNFTIVRNPYDRIISQFYYENRNKTRKNDDIEHFYQWLLQKKNIYLKNKYQSDAHFILQSEYVFDKTGKQKIEYVIKMEDDFVNKLDHLFNTIYNLNLDITKFPKSNVTKKTFSKNDLNIDAKNIIYNWYRDDFINFNYKK